MSKNVLKHNVPLRFGTASSDPGQTENGVIYYNTTDNLFKVYENSQWVKLASRSYVDSVAAGFDPKESVVAASTANLENLASIDASLDGVSLSNGDRVLLKDQSSASQNGIYVYTSGSLARAVDFDDAVEVNGGEYVFVKGGSLWAATAWVVTSSPAVIGTDAITWTQVAGAGKSLNSAYLTGNSISTSGGNNVIIAGSERLQVTASSGVSISNALSAGATTLTSASVTGALSVGAAKLIVDSNGNLTKINNVSYSFPATQASGSNYVLRNDGSGNLTWNSLRLDAMNDLLLTSLSDKQILRYDSASSLWKNESAISSTTGSSMADKIIATNASGYLDTSFLQYNIDLGGNKISGVASPSVSSDAATKGYIDALTLNIVYGQDEDGSGATISTNATDGDVIIAGTEKLQVTAAGGMEITNFLTIGSSASVAQGLSVANGNFAVSAAGDISAIRGVTYSFPEAQASGANYALVNNGSGSLSWNTLALSGLSDVMLTSVSDKQILRYDSASSKWKNESAIASTSGSSDANKIIMTNASGKLDSSFLQFNIDFGGNILSGVASPDQPNDAVNKAYVDAQVTNAVGSVTLQQAYNQDGDGGDVLITTNSVDGSIIIAGSEALKVSAAGGFLLADSSDASKYVQMLYKDAVALSVGSAVLSALTYPHASIGGMMVEYRVKEAASSRVRVGTLLVTNTSSDVSISDTFTETADCRLSWSGAINGGNVEVSYAKTSDSASMSFEVKKFMA